MSSSSCIEYSEKYEDDAYEYRHVILPKELAKTLPKSCLLTESEWRDIGVQLSVGWQNYAAHLPQPHILLFRRLLSIDRKKQTRNAASDNGGLEHNDLITGNQVRLRDQIFVNLPIYKARIGKLGSINWRKDVYAEIGMACCMQVVARSVDFKAYGEQIDALLSKYELCEATSLLELAVWKALCLADISPSSGPRTYHEYIVWVQEGWKQRKAFMRNSNGIAIVMKSVIPFLLGIAKTEHDWAPPARYQFQFVPPSTGTGFFFPTASQVPEVVHLDQGATTGTRVAESMPNDAVYETTANASLPATTPSLSLFRSHPPAPIGSSNTLATLPPLPPTPPPPRTFVFGSIQTNRSLFS